MTAPKLQSATACKVSTDPSHSRRAAVRAIAGEPVVTTTNETDGGWVRVLSLSGATPWVDVRDLEVTR